MDHQRQPASTSSKAAAPSPRAGHRMRGAIAALALFAGGSPLVGGGAVAQQRDVQITVASAILAEPVSQAQLPIQVGPPGALPGNSFIRLRGLPPTVSLTEGHAIGPGSWAIPLFGLPSLKANVPAGVSGRSELIINLVAVDGTVLAEARTSLVVGPAAMIAPDQQPPTEQRRATAVAPPPPVPAGRPDRNTQAAPRPPELPAEERARAEKLIAQGQRYLEQGSIVLAREFFRRAADVGYAPGAIRLAATYDPAELSRLQAQGVVPDRAEARKWYERARELGAPEAEERLARLAGS